MNHTRKEIRLVTWNANGGVRAKTTETNHFLLKHKVDILLINETNLIPNDKWQIANYKTYRTDRPGKVRAGGTAILISKEIKHHQIIPASTPNIETTAIIIDTSLGKLKIIAAYASPKKCFNGEDIDNLLEGAEPTIIAGDLNCKHHAWNSKAINKRGKDLYKHSMNSNYAVIGPLEPTHYPGNKKHNPDVLDIAIINDLAPSITIETLQELSSDHNPVLIIIGNANMTTEPINPKFNFNKANWTLFRSCLDKKLPKEIPQLTCPDEIDSFTKFLTTIIEESMETTIPKKTEKRNTLFDLPPGLAKAVQFKNRTRRLYQNRRTPELKKEFNAQQKKLKNLICEFRRDRWEDTTSKLNFKNNSIWIMTRRLQRKPTPDPPIKAKFTMANTTQEKADAIAESLAESFTPNKPNAETKSILQSMKQSLRLLKKEDDNIKPITFEELQIVARQLSQKKAPGGDGITNSTIINLSVNTIHMFLELTNAVLNIQHFPSLWKKTKVVAFLKPGKPPSDPPY